MAEEVKVDDKTTQENATVTEKVTDEALSSAWDQDQTVTKTEEKTEQKTEAQTETDQTDNKHEEVIPEEPTDNSERTRLGRNVKLLQEKIDKISEMLSRIPAPPEQKKTDQPSVPFAKNDVSKYLKDVVNRELREAVERGELPENPITAEEIASVQNFCSDVRDSARSQIEEQSNVQYMSQYSNVLQDPKLKGETPDDIHAEIIAELHKIDSPFNRRQYDNPMIDAQVNYFEAKAKILENRLTGGKKGENKFKGKPPNAPATGVTVNTRTTEANEEMPTLDEASLDFIKRTGMSTDSVKSALKTPLPIHLRGR